MTITNNMSHNAGSIQNANQDIANVSISDSQGTIIIVGSFLILGIVLYLFFNLIKTYINKSCLKCKYIKNCENEIKHIKKDLMLNNIVDSEVLQTIAEDVATVKKKVLEYGTNGTIHR